MKSQKFLLSHDEKCGKASPHKISAAKVQKITRKAIPLNAMIDEFYCFLMNFTYSNSLFRITFAEENANNL